MPKRIHVEHDFTLPDDVTDDGIAYIIGAMGVQAEEPVIGWGDHGDEIRIDPLGEVKVKHTVTEVDDWTDEPYIDDLARFTAFLDALGSEHVYGYETAERGQLLLVTVDDEHNLRLGIADYTDEHWGVVAYGGEREHEWFDITPTIGKVPVDRDADPVHAADQVELARRVRFYLASTQWSRDYESLTIYHHTGEGEQRTLCGDPDLNAMTIAAPDGVNCGGCLDKLGLG